MGPPDWVSAPAPAACVSLIAIRTKGPDTAWFVICVPSPAKNHSRPGLQLDWQEPQPSATPGAQGVLVLGESRRRSLRWTHEPRNRSDLQHFKASHGADCVLSFCKSTLQILTRLTLSATHRGGYRYHPQVTHEKTEAQISN